jgi:DNA-binding MarR family transcriptional regulator
VLQGTVNRHIADELLAASRALVAVAAKSLAGVDVTLPQYRALVILSAPSPTTVGSLADALDVHPSTATRLCDRLVGKRLIRRLPGRSGDRREVALTLTAQGRRLVEQVMTRRRRELAEIAGRMSASDQEQAVQGLWAFAEAAGELVFVDAFGWGEDHGES